MKGNKAVICAAAVLMALMLAGASGVFVYAVLRQPESADGQEGLRADAPDITKFGAYVDCEVFAEVPAMSYEGATVGTAEDYGDGNYVLDVNGATKGQYEDYIALLLEEGFAKHSDNGEEGLEGYIYTTNLTRDDLVLTVSHMVKQNKTYLSASTTETLSDHLNYSEEYTAGAADAATKVHMLELNDNGNSFIIQLKNGHFIIEDGGNEKDAPYLLDYLESLVPEGEKPVVEAWFITHAHGDHHGALLSIGDDAEQADRLYVEEIFFTAPNEDMINELIPDEAGSLNSAAWTICRVNAMFKKENGDTTEFHRMITGQRLYYCDIVIDVPLTLEQFPKEKYFSSDFNDTSTWLMHHIDGQRLLIVGDTYYTGLMTAMQIYDKGYFDLEVYVASHHGINVYDWFTDYCTVDTLLYPSWRAGSIWWLESSMTEEELAMVEAQGWTPFRSVNAQTLAAEAGNEYIKECVKEYYHRGDGTVVLTFPYTVGSAEVLESQEWTYSATGYPQRTWMTNLE